MVYSISHFVTGKIWYMNFISGQGSPLWFKNLWLLYSNCICCHKINLNFKHKIEKVPDARIIMYSHYYTKESPCINTEIPSVLVNISKLKLNCLQKNTKPLKENLKLTHLVVFLRRSTFRSPVCLVLCHCCFGVRESLPSWDISMS